jgi:nitrogen fixation protein FixH
MPNILVSLAIGIGLILVGFTLLYKFTRMQGKQVALIMFMGVVGIYVPYSILNWHGMDIFAIHIALFGTTPYVLGIITSHWEIRKKLGEEDDGRWFHWAPATMVVFFIIIATVDAIIITLSREGMSNTVLEKISPREEADRKVTTAFPGTTADDFQEKYEQFNDYQTQLQLQQERGWQVKKGFLDTPYANEPVPFQVLVLDKAGQPVSGAEIQARFLRPSDKRADFEFSLEEIEPGLHRTELTMPLAGRWYLVMKIVKDEAFHETRGWTQIEVARGQ